MPWNPLSVTLVSLMEQEAIIAVTRRWIAELVIALNLCPFARRVFQEDKIRYAVSLAESESALVDDLERELTYLAAAPAALTETTLLILPRVLGNFLDYNDFLDSAEARIDDLALRGVLQVASFHPDYQFADTPPDAVENYTNRSPYPMLHLLREDSISAVAGEDLLEIPRRNIETLKSLGLEAVVARLKQISADTSS
jgi:hypothetical protein